MLESVITGIRALIIDMDGVLWRQSQPLVDLPAVFGKFAKRGLKVTLVTNNATLSVDQYLEKLEGFGISLNPGQIVNSPIAVANYLRGFYPKGGSVYVIGESGLVKTLGERGFHLAKNHVVAVVVGMDRDLTYEKLCRATLLIRGGVRFIGTNADKTFPVPEGLVPGVGAILAALEVASDVKPHVVGKPEPEMYRIAIDRMDVSPSETLVIGDRLETDILGAQKLGCRTALVLSGVSSSEAANKWLPPPDIITKDLESVLQEF
jgi:4-nitrophenyl phosphatase